MRRHSSLLLRFSSRIAISSSVGLRPLGKGPSVAPFTTSASEKKASTDVPLHLVKELRAQTAAGIMDCREALAQSGNDLNRAVQWLLEQARKKAAKKASRPTPEGVLALQLDSIDSPHSALLVELNSETDFVSRLETFQTLAAAIARTAYAELPNLPTTTATTTTTIASGTGRAGQVGHHQKIIISLPMDWVGGLTLRSQSTPAAPQPRSVTDSILALFMQVGENLVLRRGLFLQTPAQGLMGTYMHGSGHPSAGAGGHDQSATRIGSLASIVTLATGSKEPSSTVMPALIVLANRLAKHIAGANPRFVHAQDIPLSAFEQEKNSNPDFDEKRFVREVALMEQEVDDSSQETTESSSSAGKKNTTVASLLEGVSREVGMDVRITDFVRWKCGEGVEKKVVDFAEEVRKEVLKHSTT